MPRLPKFELAWRDVKAIEWLACTLGPISLFAFWFSFRESLPPGLRQPFVIIANFFFLCMILIVILHLQHKVHTLPALFFYVVLIPGRAIISVTQGFFAPAIVIGVALLMTYATMRRRIPWLIVAFGLAGFCALQPVKASLRSQVWTKGVTNREQSDSDKLKALTSTVELGAAMLDTLDLKVVASLAVERLSQLVMFEKVISYTPGEIPYWEGRSYYPFFFKPIPRVMFPDKPDEDSNLFGHEYGIIQPEDYTTAINLPQLVEFYGNFGAWGVVLGSFFVGTLYRLIEAVFVHPKMGIGALASAIYILSLWLNLESNLSLVFGGLVGMSVGIGGFHLMVTAISQRPRANEQRTSRRVSEAHAVGAEI